MSSLQILDMNYPQDAVENMVGNFRAIRTARENEDVWGVLEKVAYFYSRRRRESQDRNWKDAQKATAINLATLNLSKPEGQAQLENMLREQADQASKIHASLNLSQPEYWKMGQAHLAAGFKYWDTTSLWDAWRKVEAAYHEMHPSA